MSNQNMTVPSFEENYERIDNGKRKLIQMAEVDVTRDLFDL
jgi:hypothetical protein